MMADILKDVLTHGKELRGEEEPHLIALARLLDNMGEYELAKEILTQVLNESLSEEEAAYCYRLQGEMTRLRDDYDTSSAN
jgi:hypothetical protein